MSILSQEKRMINDSPRGHDFSDNQDFLETPPKNSDYLNDIGGPRAVGGARQRTIKDWVTVGDKVEGVTRLAPSIKPTPE